MSITHSYLEKVNEDIKNELRNIARRKGKRLQEAKLQGINSTIVIIGDNFGVLLSIPHYYNKIMGKIIMGKTHNPLKIVTDSVMYRFGLGVRNCIFYEDYLSVLGSGIKIKEKFSFKIDNAVYIVQFEKLDRSLEETLSIKENKDIFL